MKKILLVFSLLASCAALQAQKVDSVWVATIMHKVDSTFAIGDTRTSKNTLLEALDTAGVYFGQASVETALLLETLVNVEKATGDFIAAEQTCLRFLDVCKKNYGEEHAEVAKALGQLGYIRFKLGKMETVEKLLTDSRAMQYKLNAHLTAPGCVTATNLAAYYQSQGLFLKAEQLHLEALHTWEKIEGTTDRFYGALLNNIAVFYSVAQRSGEALRYYDECMELMTNFGVPENHPYILRMRENKGRVLVDAGRYREAEATLKDVLGMALASMAPDDAQLPSFYRGLSQLYTKTGQYEEAARLEVETLRLLKIKYGETNPEYIIGLLSLSTLYRDSDRMVADSLLRHAIQIMERENRTNTIQYAQALTQLGAVWQSERQYERARPLLERGARLGAGIVGRDHPGFHASYGEYMIRQYLLENLPDSALQLLDTVRMPIVNAYGEWHERFIRMETQYGEAWQEKSDAGRALDHFQRAFDALRHNLAENFSYLTANEREKFARTFEGYRMAVLATGRDFPDDKKISAFLYDLTLFQKELLASYDRQLLAGWQQNPDSAYLAYVEVRRMIARQWTLPAKERLDLPELEARRVALEKSLAEKSLASAAEQTLQSARWTQVRQALQVGDAALEWLILPPAPGKPAPLRYAALILRHGNNAPELVLLPETARVDTLFASRGSRGLQYATRTYTGDALYRILWQPLESRLGGVKRIFYAPAGPLHLLNFDAVQATDGKLLSEKYDLVRVTNTARLLNGGFGKISAGKALLAGGLDYESAAAVRAETPAPAIGSAMWRGGSTVTEWAALPNTLPEVEHLATLLGRNKVQTILLTGRSGSETAVKAHGSAGAPDILHFATHGFFFEKNTSATGSLGLVAAENPMFRSGLILSGANPAWRGEPAGDTHDDGILTADEISLLPLRNTTLVVLSACETGLGDVSDDEGVYGLQRAFRLAGAQNIVMSLWRVPDAQTRQFMESFYAALLENGDVRQALQQARQAIRREFANPYYWAGFVLLE